MDKNLNLSIGMKAVGDFESPMSRFSDVTEKTLKVVNEYGTTLKKIGDNKRAIKGFQNSRQEMGKLAASVKEASAKTKAYKQQIETADKPSKTLINRYKQSANRLDQLTQKHKAARAETAKRLSNLKKEGIDTRNLAREQERLGKAYAQAQSSAQKFGDFQRQKVAATARIDQASQRAANAALYGGAAARGGTRVLGGLGNLSGSAMGFEDAMVEVDKFVKGANLPELKKQILELGQTSPLGSTGIAQLVAAAGKINLPADEALQFAEISEKMAVAFGISVDEAASRITSIRTGMNLSMSEIAEMGDAINYLGDSTGSNADNISNIVNRVGAIGKASGLANPQIAALAAQLDAAAPNAEIAATSMKNILTALTLGSKGSGRQKEVIGELGFDPDQLAADMQADAAGTLQKVMESIALQDAEMRNGLIAGLFGREAQAAVSNLTGNLGELNKVMGSVGNSGNYAGSSSKEYERELSKTSVQLAIQKQKWENLKIKLGEQLLPAIISLSQAIGPVIDGVAKFVENNGPLTKGLMLAAGGLAAVAVAMAPVITAMYAAKVAAAIFGKQLLVMRGSMAAASAGGMAGGGKGGGLKRMLGGKLGLLSVGVGALGVASTLTSDKSTEEKFNETAKTVGGIGGALAGGKAGAAMGAAIGTMILPGIGTAIGGFLGGLGGSAMGYGLGDWLGSKIKYKGSDPTQDSVARSRRNAVRNRGGRTLNDNSTVQITVEGSGDPEETAKKVMSALDKQRNRRRNRHQIYDIEGDVPA